MKIIQFKLIICLLFCVEMVQAQKSYTIGFYNVENLFDTINNKKKNDEEFLPKSDKQWNTEKYHNKLLHLSQVINELGGDDGPDVLGLCEIENKNVLVDLIKTPLLAKKGYQIVHYESPDDRGIDVGLLFKSNLFTLIDSKKLKVKLPDKKRANTRDILMVRLCNQKNDTFIFFVNHFPSRLGGTEKSAPNRCAAAKVLRAAFDSIINHQYNSNVIMMGDFNDEPKDSSIQFVLKCKYDKSEMSFNDLYNPMQDLKNKGLGTIEYKKHFELIDQFIMSNHLLYESERVHYMINSVEIFKPEYLVQQTGNYKGSPNRTFGGKNYLNGYSDHWPIFMKISCK